MSQDPSTFNRTEWTEYAEDSCWRGGGWNTSDPKGASWARLELAVWTHLRRIGRGTHMGCIRTDRNSGGNGTVDIGASSDGGQRGAIGFAKPDSDELTVGHADVATQAIRDVVLGSNGVLHVDKVDESAFLEGN